MNFELVAFLSVLAAFSLYGVFSSIEIAVALMRVEPRLAPDKPANRVFSPRWEINNVLLAAGCVGLAVLSSEAVRQILEATWPMLGLGFLALIMRAGSLFYLFFSKSATGARLPNYMFAASSLIVPLSLGSAGIYMITGQSFWASGPGLALFVALATGLLALAAGFIYYVGGKSAPQGVVLVGRLLNVALAAMLALMLLGVLNGDGSHLLNLPYAYLAVMSAGIVLAQSIFLASGKEWQMWWFLAVLAFLAPLLMGLANYPFLVFPDVVLEIPYEL